MRIAVLVSGNGTNLQALLDAQAAGQIAPAQVVLVISNRPQAKALERAAAAEVANLVVDHRHYPSRSEFEAELIRECEAAQVEAIVLAGFMRILSPRFVERFEGRIINTHPALCPAFPGINAPQQAIEAGVKVSGCTVHLVDTGVDTGPIVFQEAVAVRPEDTAATLHQRIQKLEHRLLPQAAQLMAAGRLACTDGRVTIL